MIIIIIKLYTELFDVTNLFILYLIISCYLNIKEKLRQAIVSGLKDMIRLGGRDTEKDLFDRPGGYVTAMSKNTVGKPCARCRSVIVKENYMGGSIYYCPGCQK